MGDFSHSHMEKIEGIKATRSFSNIFSLVNLFINLIIFHNLFF